MSDRQRSADDLARELIASTGSSRRKASIAAVCEALAKLGERREPITVAAVARLTEKLPGGPKEQSIRNDPNGLKHLIELAGRSQALPIRTGLDAAGKGSAANWFDSVPDPLVRSRCRALAEHLRLLEGENARLRAAMKRLQAINHLDEIAAAGDLPSAEVGPRLSEEEQAAIGSFLARLEDEGFAVDPASGELLSRSGRTVAPPAFIAGLRKLSRED